jgi:tRNA pseudouridine55 synthase
MSEPPEGLLLIDNPEGPTSHDVVAAIRKRTGQRRVGHAGTLDPMASGLLPLVLGRATRLVRFLPHEPKLYEGRLRLGLTTDTDDITGEVLTRHEGPLPASKTVAAAAAALVGRIRQVTPAVSARKVGGQRMYRLARKKIAVTAPAHEVEVTKLEIGRASRNDEWDLVAEVSAGTYVRALARDLGAAVGTGGTLVALRRLRVGPFGVDDAIPLPAADAPVADLAEGLIALDDVPLVPPTVDLPDPGDARRFCSGSPVTTEAGIIGAVRVAGPGGRLLGIGETEGGTLKPRVVVASEPGMLL